MPSSAYKKNTPFFTDFKFHNTGVAATDILFDKLMVSITSSSSEATLTTLAHSAVFSELGPISVTLKPTDFCVFKSPTLPDIELTSPYMHDGSVKTLIDVVQFYNRGRNVISLFY